MWNHNANESCWAISVCFDFNKIYFNFYYSVHCVIEIPQIIEKHIFKCEMILQKTLKYFDYTLSLDYADG